MDANLKREAKAILDICQRYGYGNVMEWVSAFYRRFMKEKGLPPEHAYIAVIAAFCDADSKAVKFGQSTREVYDEMVQDFMEGNHETLAD